MDIKNLIQKVDKAKVLSVASAVVGIGGMLLSNKVDANNRMKLKEDLKKEVLNELSQKN